MSMGVFQELPERFQNFLVCDYGDRLIIPGMVDLHIHAPQYAYRGYGMDQELLDWLNKQAFPEEIKYADLDYAKDAYRIFAKDMKKSATSRACIFATCHREATELLMELMECSGLISYVGKVNMDRNGSEALTERDADTAANDTESWVKSTAGCYERTKPILTPRFIPNCSDELLGRLGEIQKKYHLPVQSHLSENPDEVEWVRALCPRAEFYGDAYDIYGLFGKETKTVMAHCVYSSEKEIERIKDNGVFIAHCPASNMNLASGIAPVRTYLTRGLRVGLGSDVAGGHTESIFRAVTDAIQVSKLYRRLADHACEPLTFDEAFYLATKGGGAFFGNVGGFEEGYEFDALVMDDIELPHPQELSVRQRLERMFYLSWDIKGIYAKYVAGTLLFREGEKLR